VCGGMLASFEDWSENIMSREIGRLTFLKSRAASISSMTYSGVGL
jgi:hypothetical protein